MKTPFNSPEFFDSFNILIKHVLIFHNLLIFIDHSENNLLIILIKYYSIRCTNTIRLEYKYQILIFMFMYTDFSIKFTMEMQGMLGSEFMCEKKNLPLFMFSAFCHNNKYFNMI
jgi:hypothetical protein